MPKRRILFLHLGHDFGGIEVYLANLVALLRDEAQLFACCSHPRLIDCLEAQQVRVLRLPQWRGPLLGPLRGLRFLVAALVLPFVLLRNRIDTVHINGHWESALLLPCRLLGRTAIVTRHQTWVVPQHSLKHALSALVANAGARFAGKVICVSQAVADEAQHHLPHEKTAVIPNWIAAQPPSVERAPVQYSQAHKARLLFVGRMTVFKGLHLVLEAMRGLPNVQLTAVGEGPKLDEFRGLARGLDVTFAGFHRDVMPFYRDADIFIMPSIGLEGLPLVSLEAMGHGLPCLFSDLSVHREITANGHAAALFRTGDAEDLRQKLCALLEDAAERDRLARAGYAMVQSRYTAEVARRAYIEAFQLAPTQLATGQLNTGPLKTKPL
jgi:glycosyltransferase involved in cell wall biosynthesis